MLSYGEVWDADLKLWPLYDTEAFSLKLQVDSDDVRVTHAGCLARGGPLLLAVRTLSTEIDGVDIVNG